MAQLFQRRHVLGAAAGIVLTGATTAVARFAPDECRRTETIRVSSSTEKADVIGELVDKYNASGRAVGDLCARVTLSALTSGTTKNLLARGEKPAEVWLPTSSMWLRLLEHEGQGRRVVNNPTPSITKSTLVIAMPDSVAKALDVRNGLHTWADVLRLAQRGWSEYGRTEWGKFILGRDNAETSTSGLAATVATYHAVGVELTPERLDEPEVQGFVRDIELSVSSYGHEATQYMQDIYNAERLKDPDAPDYRPHLDAVVIQEQMAYLYNLGGLGAAPDQPRPRNPLRAVHPTDGTLELDHPFVILDSATPDQRAVADDFYEFLTSQEQQERFVEAGFRALNDAARPTEQLRETLRVPGDQRLTFVPPPDGELLAAMLQSWQAVSRKARVLLLLDVSGSMDQPVDDPDRNPDPSKLQLMIPAAKSALDLLNVEDQVGLWTFSSPSYTEVMSVSRVGEVREQLKAMIDGLVPRGATALYEAIDAADQMMTNSWDRERINAIVLLSDGANTEPYDGNKEGLLAKLNPQGREISIPIFTIPYGRSEHDEIDTLAKISSITRAGHYDTGNPLGINETFQRVFRNFG